MANANGAPILLTPLTLFLVSWTVPAVFKSFISCVFSMSTSQYAAWGESERVSVRRWHSCLIWNLHCPPWCSPFNYMWHLHLQLHFDFLAQIFCCHIGLCRHCTLTPSHHQIPRASKGQPGLSCLGFTVRVSDQPDCSAQPGQPHLAKLLSVNNKLQLAAWLVRLGSLIQKVAAQYSALDLSILRFRIGLLFFDVWLLIHHSGFCSKVCDCFFAFSQQMCGGDTCLAQAQGCESEEVPLVWEQQIWEKIVCVLHSQHFLVRHSPRKALSRAQLSCRQMSWKLRMLSGKQFQPSCPNWPA